MREDTLLPREIKTGLTVFTAAWTLILFLPAEAFARRVISSAPARA
jgi:hypothetical protein